MSTYHYNNLNSKTVFFRTCRQSQLYVYINLTKLCHNNYLVQTQNILLLNPRYFWKCINLFDTINDFGTHFSLIFENNYYSTFNSLPHINNINYYSNYKFSIKNIFENHSLIDFKLKHFWMLISREYVKSY